MSEKAKAQRRRGVAKGSQTKRYRQPTISHESQQRKSRPGTALTAFLKRYRLDLLSLTPDRHISQLLDCTDCLLMEAERGCND